MSAISDGQTQVELDSIFDSTFKCAWFGRNENVGFP